MSITMSTTRGSRNDVRGLLRTCPKTEFEEGRLRWRSRGVSHPFEKSANGWGTERLCRVGSGQILVPGQGLRGLKLRVLDFFANVLVMKDGRRAGACRAEEQRRAIEHRIVDACRQGRWVGGVA